METGSEEGEIEMKLLLAEDDAVSRTILKKSVEKLGHQSVVAADGEEAWDLFQKTPDLDVIISDWMMPGMDGLELCRRIRASQMDRERYPYFIFLTTMDEPEHLAAGMQAGADDYMLKPLDRERLRLCLISVERVTSMHRELAERTLRDPLTGLGNRRRLAEDLAALRSRAGRYGHCYCLMTLGINSFEEYSGSYGRAESDALLRRVAEVISAGSRAGDIAYRYGDSEFILVLPEQSIEGAAAAAERLRQSAGRILEGNGAGYVTLSVGLTRFAPAERKSAGELLREAERALRESERRWRQ